MILTASFNRILRYTAMKWFILAALVVAVAAKPFIVDKGEFWLWFSETFVLLLSQRNLCWV